MEPESDKKHIKLDVLKKHVLEHDFPRFRMAWASQNTAKIKLFWHCFWKCRFRKNHAPVEAKLVFFRFGASKNRAKIDANTHSGKTSTKIGSNIDFRTDLRLQKPSKSRRKATLNEACFATLCNLRGNRRKSTGGIVCKASKWLRIWLCLLHPSIHPSIHQDCPRSP